MQEANGIIWSVNPVLFEIGNWSVRWYGLLFALGFVFGIVIITRMFKYEGIKKEWVDSLFLYVVIGTVVGARLGHVFFYDWSYYRENLDEIIKIWHGGLASHGGVLGIALALWLWSRKYSKKSVLWIIDRVVVPTALVSALIRLGNLMNSEIIGKPTDVPWAFTFTSVDNLPRHPSQLYESLTYLAVFGLLMYLYWKTDIRDKTGKLFGILMTLVFSARFLIEFTKENQAAFEANIPLNMGQWLSVPFILIGLYFWLRPFEKKAQGT